ncbi:transglutaminase-like putative cysteine protease [Methanofollis sp. W23]|uniref:transglutaminase domain-containing protein n=1 Tax=Methanofollis sp. W23 TaxID=2817849 RepID=UPI001AE18496|nr:transglutaminase domain-containing protein [Methanofollis sp. W23]MBP2146230.1 transglutaminase-like putative cysteine protease [Methanofollis sp. W23]
MYCRKCGAKIEDDTQYCTRCGAATRHEDEGDAAYAPAPAPAPAKKNSLLDRSHPLLWACLGIGFCFIFVLLFAIDDDGWTTEVGAAIQDATDYQDPATRDFALTLVNPENTGEFNIAQACDVWEAVYDQWTYVEDPLGTDYFSPASRTIEVGLKGDCDDFAVLMTALMAAIGGEARVVAAYDGYGNGHAFSEIYVGDHYEDLKGAAHYVCDRYQCTTIWYHCREGLLGTEYWINLDWQNDHPGGYYFPCADAVAVYTDGTEEYLSADGDPVRSIRCWTGG